MAVDLCPHGCGSMMQPVNGDPLEPDSPYCPECGHIKGNDCDDGCDYGRRTVEWRDPANEMTWLDRLKKLVRL